MKYAQFLDNTTKTWLLADGGGGTKLGEGCAKQTPGNPAVLSLNPGGKPYMDAYWYMTFGPQVIAKDIWVETQTKFPSAKDLASCEGREWETDWITSGVHYNTGMQADFNTGTWRTFDLPTGHWVDSKIGLPIASAWLSGVTAVSIHSVIHAGLMGLAAGGIRYEGLLVNGQWYSIGTLSKSVKKNEADHFNLSTIQLDGNQHGDAYSCEVAQADVRIL